MARTKRGIIDQGFFDTDGIAWSGREEFSYTFEELPSVALDDHIVVQVPFPVYLGGVAVTQLTVWGRGLISIGPPTEAQAAFMRTWLSNTSIFAFPGDFISLDMTSGVAASIEVGRGYVDRSDEPNSSGGSYGFDEYSARDRFTIRIAGEAIEFDESGFTVLYPNNNNQAGYRLGGVEYAYVPNNLPPFDVSYVGNSVLERTFIYVSNFETLPSTISGDLITGTLANDELSPVGDPTTSDAQTIAGLGGNDLISGGVGNDVLTGGQGDDEINGDPVGSVFGGDDNIHGGEGADFLKGGFGSDFLFGDGGNDVLHGGAGQDLLRGGDGNDYMLGEDGSDILDGGAGADTMRGEGGGDIYYVDNAGDDVFEGFTSGTDIIYTSLAVYTMPNGIEELYASSSSNLNLTGNPSANIINGNYGDDVLTGRSGADTLRGSYGRDTFLDTAAGLNLDTIGDFSAIDRIVISDATLAGFTFSLVGSTLTYTGGSLTLSGGITGRLVATAAPGGGVQLTINEVRNDFNGDGRSDILWRNVNGQMSNWLGQANGGFVQNNANAAGVVPIAWQIAGTGDFNGDGRDDILWRNVDGQLSNWLATDNGGYTPNDSNAAAFVSTSWSVVGTGDFNGDGFDDILWRHTDGTLSNWLNNAYGSGGFIPNDANAARFVPTSWTVVGTGDFNGDGRDDVLWRNSNGQVSDWLGQANGGFVLNDAVALTQVDTAWKVVGTGDFNGDGRDDILWRHTNGSLSNWLGQANGGFVNNGAISGTFVPLTWTVVAVGDYNGDGRDDILWRNSNGIVTDWLANANGSFTPNDAAAAQVVPTAWHVQPEAPFL
jgi:Ca2+-binding RTX toxin-like protein